MELLFLLEYVEKRIVVSLSGLAECYPDFDALVSLDYRLSHATSSAILNKEHLADTRPASRS